MNGQLPHSRIAIVGTGFSGLGMAIRLKQEGIEDFVVLERASDVGGTWRDNTYPGCACDVPSHLYSFSFEPNPEWSSTFSPQAEIWDYLRHCADKYGVRPYIRFDSEVLDARWENDEQRWRIDTATGPLTADVLIAGMGGLSEPSIPEVPGLDRFKGAMFHSARWDHQHELDGERVAVIGTGASAIQFVPQIQPKVGALHLFQRTPPWIMPRRDRPLTRFERVLYRRLPIAQLAMRAGVYWARESFVLQFMHPRFGGLPARIAKAHLRKQVSDPALRRKLLPRYGFGCKRVLISNDYFPALTKPNVEVVTDGIREVRGRSIVTADGTVREIDTIIFGTGFNIADMGAAQRVRGRDGVLMADAWEQTSPKAHLGTTVTGFPNLFLLVGPNTGLGHNSIVFMIESQFNLVLDALRHMERHGVAEIEPRPEAQAAFNRELADRLEGTVWNDGGCASWYLDANGRNFTLWPGITWPFRERTRKFAPAEYELRGREPAREPAAA